MQLVKQYIMHIHYYLHYYYILYLLLRLLGRLAPYLTLTIAPSEDGGLDPFSQVLQFHLNTKNAVQRMQVAMVIEEWAKAGLQVSWTGSFRVLFKPMLANFKHDIYGKKCICLEISISPF